MMDLVILFFLGMSTASPVSATTVSTPPSTATSLSSYANISAQPTTIIYNFTTQPSSSSTSSGGSGSYNSSLFSSDLLYPYGSALDALCPVSDDGSSPRINLSVTLSLLGRNYSYLYVNNNGLLSFKDPIFLWTPELLPTSLDNPLLAVFWADADNRRGGNIYYRQSQDTGLLARATSDIRNYTQDQNFQAQWVFVATWHRVAYHGSTGNRVNT
ncbi:hypothetical protein GDO81_020868, partial [Engystomops pustulosus]